MKIQILKNKMKNKKAFLLAEETLKIIIALLGIVVLMYFLSGIYFNYSDSKKLETAKSTLDNLVEIINSEDAKITSAEIFNPEDWYLISWPQDSSTPLPKKCSSLGWDNCICICDNKFHFSETLSAISEDCDELGYCLKPEKRVVLKDGLLIENDPVKLNLDRNIENIIITRGA